MEKYLKPRQHYIDLYDRRTVERCRDIIRIHNEKPLGKPPIIDGKKATKEEMESIAKMAFEFMLHIETGERYSRKEETIRKWMEADEGKDKLLESAEAPKEIRCLTCRRLLEPTIKDLWTELDKPDRVLFMYDCPNKCLPNRSFFSDGEEWRITRERCPNCGEDLKIDHEDDGKKLTTKRTCVKCGYTNTDEYEWKFKQKEAIDENFAKDRDRFCLTDEQGEGYQDDKWRMEQLGKLTEEWKVIEKDRDEKLKANPNGFYLDGRGYTCFICGQSSSKEPSWYDTYGIKCLICQRSIDLKEIPASLAKDKDSWYSAHEIERNFSVKGPALRSWIKKGILKVRNVTYEGKGVHCQLFLIEDNKDTLPPKKLVEWRSVREHKDGKDWYHSEPWYKFVNPHEHLKDYKIMDYLQVVTEEPKK